ncbi:MAG: phosphate ABC transporter permease PstA [Thermoleophilia bacterium]|nr:phosphate ABC transporter permease PstA [Thermoleophilia bacterium]
MPDPAANRVLTGVTPESVLGKTSSGRRRKDVLARGMIALLTAVALVPLILILFFLVKKGAGALSVNFFTTDPTGSYFGDPGGIRSAIVGSIEIMLLATAIAVPIGIGVALYLTEYARDSRFGGSIRFLMDVLTGVPSIMFGLFIYITLVLSGIGGGFAGWKGSLALAILMLPIVERSVEVALLQVPPAYGEAGFAVGAARWQVILKVVLPAALPGILTGALLAVARATGETAPLLFTAAIAKDTTFNLGAQMNSLPAQIFSDVGQAQNRLVERAWGAALTLVVMILLLNLGSRWIARRSAAGGGA